MSQPLPEDLRELKARIRFNDALPSNPDMALVHVRAQADQVTKLIFECVEERWPGITAVANELAELERALLRRMGALA